MIATGQFTIVDLNDITTSATAPSNPSLNALWLDTTTNELKKYNGSSWVAATKYTDNTVANAAKNAIDNLSVGARNLAFGTGTATGDVNSGTMSGSQFVTDLYDGIYGIKTGGAWQGRTFNLKAIAARGGFQVGDKLVLSVYIKADEDVTLNVTSHRTTGTGNTSGSTKIYSNFTVTTKWQRVWFPFTADEGSLNRTDTRIEVNKATVTTTESNYIYWAGWKLEKGTTGTDWTPAPEDVDKKIDTKAEIWFYSGTPTLSNAPVSTWDIEEYSSHVGDMYYDTSTGYGYRFKLTSGVYSWEKIQDKDTIEALALANSASDTADSKRRVFMAQPYPPYDNGDLWINNQEIYVCQISKQTGTFASNDFIIATKYTDDTVANQVGDNLEVVRGQVTTITEGVDAFKIDINTQIKTINDLQEETVESLERMSYTFNSNDLTIANSNDPVNTRINNQGLKVYNYTTLNSIFNHRGTGVQKLIVVGDTQLANISIVKSKDENGDDCTDFNYLVSNIQDLTDLEGGE